MKVVLIFPPGGSITQPYTSLPCLTAALKQNGHSVIQKDLSLEAFKFFLSSQHIKECVQICERRVSQLNTKKELLFKQQAEYLNLCELLLTKKEILENYNKSLGIFRNKQNFLDPHQLYFARKWLDAAFRLASAAFFPTRLTNTFYYQRFDRAKISSLIEAISNRNENMFAGFLKENIVPGIIKKKPDLVGISITFASQLIPGLTLAKLIKERNRNIHICLGGTRLLYMTEILQKSKELFSLFDSVILYEGETALLALLEQLRTKRNFKKVPNIIAYDGKKIIKSERIHIEDINSLPTPCFDGIDLNEYLLPEKVVALPPSRGCYWNKCVFCGMSPTLHLKYRERNPELFLEDIKSIKQKYDVGYFSFNSDIAPPRFLLQLSRLLIRDKISIKWDSEVRFEKGFSYETCKTLHRGGCCYLRFGLESGNQRILNIMQKGTNLQTIEQVIDNCYRARIMAGVQAFVGFPGETRKEAKDTLNFIIKNSKKLGTVVIGKFLVVKYSSVYKCPDKYGITITSPDMPIQETFDYDIRGGISPSEAEQLRNEFTQKLGKLFPWKVLCFDACGSPTSILYAARYETDKLCRYGGKSKKIDTRVSNKKNPLPLKLYFDINKIINNIKNENRQKPLPAEKKPLLIIKKGNKLVISKSK